MKFFVLFVICTISMKMTMAQSPLGSHKKLVINEIMYKSLKEFDTDDWIEIYNPNDYDLNISGWLLKDDKDYRHFVFPNNTTVRKHDFMVIIETENKFNLVHPDVTNYVGTFTFGFGTDDMVRIYDRNLELVDSVKYSNEYPWYPETDGLGPSLELISPLLDNTKPQSWRPSLTAHGTPGRANSVTSIESFNYESDFRVAVFPNPLSICANIDFEHANDGFLTIEIHDIFGHLIRTILNQYMTSGIYTTYWDGRDNLNNTVAPGIYFLSVKAQKVAYIKKIVKSNN